MIFEIGSALVMGGVAAWAYTKQSGKGPTMNDADKINRIFANAGWVGSKGETFRLHRKYKTKNYVEYVYQQPLGFDRDSIMKNQHILEDGLNVKSKINFEPGDLLKLRFNKNILEQLREIFNPKGTIKKEISIEFDGMLKIKVFNQPLTDNLTWDDEYLKQHSWKVPVGQTKALEFVYHDFAKSPHMLIAGGTGFGKSQYLKLIITSLALQQSEYTNLTLIDLKGGTAFQRFKDLKQTKNYATTPGEAYKALKTAQDDMAKTLKKVVGGGHEDIVEAGIKERHFIIVDEAADLGKGSPSMEIVADIARRGRGAGYHLIYCTQYPTNDTIPSQVRPNIGARICFKLTTGKQSQAVLDEVGAEDLPEIKGRGIYQLSHNVTLQVPYITNKEIDERLEPYKVEAKADEQQGNSERTENRQYSIEFKQVGLPNKKSNSKNA